MKTSTVTPTFIAFLISPCPVTTLYEVSSDIHGGNLLLLGNHLKDFKGGGQKVVNKGARQICEEVEMLKGG